MCLLNDDINAPPSVLAHISGSKEHSRCLEVLKMSRTSVVLASFVLALVGGCCRNPLSSGAGRATSPDAGEHTKTITNPESGAPAGDTGPCFQLVKSSVEVGEAPVVVFDPPLTPPPEETFWVATVPAAHPEHISRREKILEAGVARVELDPLPYAAEWEVRLHDSYPRLEKHIVCRRPLTVIDIPPEKIAVNLETLGLTDDQATKLFVGAIPEGSMDASVAPRRWEVQGLSKVSRFVIGRHATKNGPRMALVVQGHQAEGVHLVVLPGTSGAMLTGVADLLADADNARIHTYPPAGGGKAKSIEVPDSARFPALLLSTDLETPSKSSKNLVIISLGTEPPRVVLEFPLASSGPEGSFSTLRGPDFRAATKGEMLDVALLQHAHPRTGEGRPGPPTTFVCRWNDERYTCGR